MTDGPIRVDVEIKGLDELRKKLTSDVAGPPATRFLTRVGGAVVRQAKPITPVAFGTLKRSIDKRVDSRLPIPQYVEIGSNVEYAPFVEFGRGPGERPPFDAINLWYRRKNKLGLNKQTASVGDDVVPIDQIVGNIQDAIAARGTKPQPYLRPALENSIPDITGYVISFRDDLERAFKRGSS